MNAIHDLTGVNTSSARLLHLPLPIWQSPDTYLMTDGVFVPQDGNSFGPGDLAR